MFKYCINIVWFISPALILSSVDPANAVHFCGSSQLRSTQWIKPTLVPCWIQPDLGPYAPLRRSTSGVCTQMLAWMGRWNLGRSNASCRADGRLYAASTLQRFTVLCKLIGTTVNYAVILGIFTKGHPCLTSKCILFLKNNISFCNLFGRGVYVDLTLSFNI